MCDVPAPVMNVITMYGKHVPIKIKIYYKATVIKITCNCQIKRHIDQNNTVNTPHKYHQLVLTKWRKDSLSTSDAGANVLMNEYFIDKYVVGK